MDDLVSSIVFFALLAVPLATIWLGIKWAIDDANARGGSRVLAVFLVVVLFPVGILIWVSIRPGLKNPFPGIRAASGRRPPH